MEFSSKEIPLWLSSYPTLVSSKQISLFMSSVVFNFKLSQHSGLFSYNFANPFTCASLEFVIIKK